MSKIIAPGHPAPGLPPHILRMMEEGDELAKKADKLHAFMGTDTFMQMHALDGQLMMAQYSAMQTYLRILSLRLARANDHHKGLIPPTASALVRKPGH